METHKTFFFKALCLWGKKGKKGGSTSNVSFPVEKLNSVHSRVAELPLLLSPLHFAEYQRMCFIKGPGV